MGGWYAPLGIAQLPPTVTQEQLKLANVPGSIHAEFPHGPSAFNQHHSSKMPLLATFATRKVRPRTHQGPFSASPLERQQRVGKVLAPVPKRAQKKRSFSRVTSRSVHNEAQRRKSAQTSIEANTPPLTPSISNQEQDTKMEDLVRKSSCTVSSCDTSWVALLEVVSRQRPIEVGGPAQPMTSLDRVDMTLGCGSDTDVESDVDTDVDEAYGVKPQNSHKKTSVEPKARTTMKDRVSHLQDSSRADDCDSMTDTDIESTSSTNALDTGVSYSVPRAAKTVSAIATIHMATQRVVRLLSSRVGSCQSPNDMAVVCGRAAVVLKAALSPAVAQTRLARAASNTDSCVKDSKLWRLVVERALVKLPAELVQAGVRPAAASVISSTLGRQLLLQC